MERRHPDESGLGKSPEISHSTLIYDGNCPLCRLMVRYLHRRAANRFDPRPYQDPNTRRLFPEIPYEAMEESVQWITERGKVRSGGEAVAAALTTVHPKVDLLSTYERTPGIAFLVDQAYKAVSRRRYRISRILGLGQQTASEYSLAAVQKRRRA